MRSGLNGEGLNRGDGNDMVDWVWWQSGDCQEVGERADGEEVTFNGRLGGDVCG